MPEQRKYGAVILGSGNIGTDLMVKIDQVSTNLWNAAMAGIDPASDGLARAARRGIATTANGIEGLADLESFKRADVIFDATSARSHQEHARFAREHDKLMIDLTPAALGAYVVPVVNLPLTSGAENVNMVTCGGQATIPIVAAVSEVAPVVYAEIVASIASRSAGPGTRANIDEFTETTSRAIEAVGGAGHGKAIIILNPAEPPIIMRDTIYCLIERTPVAKNDDHLRQKIVDSVETMAARVRQYVPGYRLKQDIQFDDIANQYIPALGRYCEGMKVTVLLEVVGAGHHLPEYAGNLDIMTSSALRTAEAMLQHRETVAP